MYYKLTDQDIKTYKGFQWELGKWYCLDNTGSGTGSLCTNKWFHCYNDPALAILLNPFDVNIRDPRLFACDTKGKCGEDYGLKFGFTSMRLTTELKILAISKIQRVAFAVLCAKEVYKDKLWLKWVEGWLKWADGWLGNVDRSESAAWSAAESAKSAAWSAAKSAAEAARSAAWSAAWSATESATESLTKLDLILLTKKAQEY